MKEINKYQLIETEIKLVIKDFVEKNRIRNFIKMDCITFEGKADKDTAEVVIRYNKQVIIKLVRYIHIDTYTITTHDISISNINQKHPLECMYIDKILLNVYIEYMQKYMLSEYHIAIVFNYDDDKKFMRFENKF